MLRRVALVRTDVSEELSASIIRETGFGETVTTLAVIYNRRKLRRATRRNISEDGILNMYYLLVSSVNVMFMTSVKVKDISMVSNEAYRIKFTSQMKPLFLLINTYEKHFIDFRCFKCKYTKRSGTSRVHLICLTVLSICQYVVVSDYRCLCLFKNLTFPYMIVCHVFTLKISSLYTD
jgi:hypothetical protein